ncbi:hypothetical protein K504DRAFT_505990 [Pleomassaria siparia CBS 279.74]|uniref:Uncharacterized protein n=1 Tax=Pleomassaria siparia CBS 279.74 TaxID=1314801 RepID=A0A6G1JY97_9PLEO|nr:hypothetical protein K504DRAFT_505990 [Pleomassaria siparia CBS 279.74]
MPPKRQSAMPAEVPQRILRSSKRHRPEETESFRTSIRHTHRQFAELMQQQKGPPSPVVTVDQTMDEEAEEIARRECTSGKSNSRLLPYDHYLISQTVGRPSHPT